MGAGARQVWKRESVGDGKEAGRDRWGEWTGEEANGGMTVRLKSQIQTHHTTPTVLHVNVYIGKKFAQAVKNLVKVLQDVPAGHLSNVVQRLARVVSHTTFGVVKTVQHRREQHR
jgi:hypothetical protein